MEENRATAHLLHGFAGSGKTTFARNLEKSENAIRYTHDEWMNRLYGPNPPSNKFEDFYNRVSDLIWDQAKKNLKLGVNVIIDFGFWSRKSRDEARSIINNVGVKFKLYNITCSKDLMKERVLKRSEKTPEDSLWINSEAFDLFEEDFEPLGNDEENILIDGSKIEFKELTNG